MATKRIDQELFVGYRVTNTQALKWPRYAAPIPDSAGWYGYYPVTEIPQPIKDATCEFALLILGSDVLAQQNMQNFKSVKAGPVEVVFNQPVRSGVLPDQVARLLRDLRTNSSGAAMVRG
jgi:hypothetical protein